MRIIAIIDDDYLGLVAETEVLGVSTEIATALVELGYARKYDATKPIVGKSVNVYQTGMRYPNERQVFKNDSVYISNVGEGNLTSDTWIPSEWTCLVHGTQAV